MRIMLLIGLLAVACPALAQSRAPTTQTAEQQEAAYAQALEKRVQEILDDLKLTDATKKSHVHDAVIAQYRALRDWHDANDAKLKELNKNTTANADAIAKIKSTLKTLHDQYLAKLALDLSPDQIDLVKDRMTYRTLEATYNGYCQEVPMMTEAQKAKVMEFLIQAREEAMDDGSSDEKHATFNRYKGKINNYLSKEGYDLKKLGAEWQERIKAQEQKPQ